MFQGTFSVSLLYAEFLVLMLPFALFAFLDGRSINHSNRRTYHSHRDRARTISFRVTPWHGGVDHCDHSTGLLFVVRVWRADKRSMAGGLMVILAAAGLALFAAAFISSPRLRVMTIGGGQHQASTDSRLEMWAMSPPTHFRKAALRPWSGAGR